MWEGNGGRVQKLERAIRDGRGGEGRHEGEVWGGWHGFTAVVHLSSLMVLDAVQHIPNSVHTMGRVV